MLHDEKVSASEPSKPPETGGAERLATLKEIHDRRTEQYEEVDYQMQLADSEDIGILTYLRLSDERDALALEIDRLDEQLALAENRKPPRRTE